MEVWDVSRYLEATADLLEIAGGDEANKARAYRRAAHSVTRLTTAELRALAGASRLREIPGVGPAIAGKIEELLTTGRMTYYDRLSSEVPVGLTGLLSIPGLGPKGISALYHNLGVTSFDELEQAVADGKVARTPGFGPGRQQKLKRAIDRIHQLKIAAPVGSVIPAARRLGELLMDLDDVEAVELAGEIRRGEEMIREISLIAVTANPDAITRELADAAIATELEQAGDGSVRLQLADGRRARVDSVGRDWVGLALIVLTGSDDHVDRLDRLARDLGHDGLHGLVQRGPIPTEQEVYDRLGLPLIPPEQRIDGSEVDAALAGHRFDLVRRDQIRGDLHVHSRWSHGLADIPEILAAARELGYEYLAICDHSPSLVVAGGLSVDRLLQQGEAIRELNEQSSDCRLLWGAEVDIMRDGSLDYPDDVLSRLDVVVASVHTGFTMNRDDMTARVIRAIASPHVDVIGHLTGRLLGYRGGYDLDFPAIVDACRRHNTALEINSAGDRLDISAEQARIAHAAGVPIAVNTDAHSIGALRDMELGIRIARRAGLPASMVVNTWPWSRLREFLADKP